MSFAKFMDVLTTSTLYFCRADQFEDQFEGYVNQALNKRIDNEFYEFKNAAEMRNDLKYQLNKLKELTLVNCWNICKTDSFGMWKSYCSDIDGVAIKSSIEGLKESLIGEESDSFHIRPVKYVDIETANIYDANGINLFTFKRPHFSFENELRVILPFAHTNDIRDNAVEESGAIELIPFDQGKKVKILFDKLVEEIYVAPNSPDWFVDLINRLMRFTYKKPVIRSEINKHPVF